MEEKKRKEKGQIDRKMWNRLKEINNLFAMVSRSRNQVPTAYCLGQAFPLLCFCPPRYGTHNIMGLLLSAKYRVSKFHVYLLQQPYFLNGQIDP